MASKTYTVYVTVKESSESADGDGKNHEDYLMDEFRTIIRAMHFQKGDAELYVTGVTVT